MEEMGLPDNETQKEKEKRDGELEGWRQTGRKKRGLEKARGGLRVCFSLTCFANFGRASLVFLHWL